MAPRKSHNRVPEWRVHQFRQRNKGIVYGPYDCPKCKHKKLRIRIDKNIQTVVAQCECGLEHSFKYISSYDPVDYFCNLVDEFY